MPLSSERRLPRPPGQIQRPRQYGPFQSQGGIDYGACLQKKTTLAERVVDHARDLLCQLVFFKLVAWTWSFVKAQDGGLITQATEPLELRELAVNRGFKEGLLHGPVDRLNHGCRKWMHSMLCNEKGGLPFLPSG